jgi:hypothetical protein
MHMHPYMYVENVSQTGNQLPIKYIAKCFRQNINLKCNTMTGLDVKDAIK